MEIRSSSSERSRASLHRADAVERQTADTRCPGGL